MLPRFVLVACFSFALALSHKNVTKNVLDGLEKVIDFVQSNKRLMNIDAVFGLVLGQAQISYITSYISTPEEYSEQIFLIEKKLSTTLEETKRMLEPNPKNILFLHTVLNVEAWIRNITFLNNQMSLNNDVNLRKINTYEKYVRYLTSSNFDEESSDDCFIELLQQPYCCLNNSCFINRECYKIMGLREDANFDPAYGITHSLLFLQVARSQCYKLNKNVLKKKIRKFCSYIFWELRKNAEFGFLGSLDDLFLEQITLCGFEGFSEFFAEDIIEHILWIQQPSGCFTINPEHKNYRSVRRIKRESNVILGNCIDHTTGLGVSSLSLILRYLFQK